MSTRTAGFWAVAFTLLLSAGCNNRDLRPLVPCTVSGVSESVKATSFDKVDLLFVIDNSESMTEEQAALRAEIPNLVRSLVTGDRDRDGTPDFPPVKSLQVGVVTTDMGTGPYMPGTSCPAFVPGDDGLLQTVPRDPPAGLSCMASYPPFQTFDQGGAETPNEFADAVACVASVGASGCGFEQPLEAMLKALTPNTSSVRFVNDPFNQATGALGHGGQGANAGFVRDGSLLAVVVVSDEDDCSASDLRLFDPFGTTFPFPVDIHGDIAPERQCVSHEDALFKAQRYVTDLIALRPRPTDVVFSAIVGVPTDLSGTDFAAMLADPRMQVTETPDESRIEPSCVRYAPCTADAQAAGQCEPDPNEPSKQVAPNRAYPPRRTVTTAEALDAAGANAVVESICNQFLDGSADFGPALDAIIGKIAEALSGSCLPRALNRDSRGEVTCRVLETLPAGMRCSDFTGQGRDPDPVRVEDGQEVCNVLQLVPTADDRANGRQPSGAGWFYDDFTSEVRGSCGEQGQRITFTRGAEPPSGAVVDLECIQPVQNPGTRPDINTACGSDPSVCDLSGDDLESLRQQYDRDEAKLFCEPNSNTCQLACATDADCPGGYACFDAETGNTEGPAFCVAPTCPF